jgi:hypothetical protein
MIPQLQKHSLDAPGGLGFMLHYLNSTMLLFTLQQVFALVPSMSAQYLIFGLKLLHYMLLNMPKAKIAWPSEHTIAQWPAIIHVYHPTVKHVIGFVDGVYLPLECHGEELIQNAYYNS